ncbi:MAG: class I SAM-dependent methyltransferase [Desulfobacterales bacterium]|nr:class I SAM-dependent methyltransferase [Desulfobacterales bacterium]MCP4158957.1 class I SAM-dependent methyltransferase [Deltaproteobacteria bacterium]
MGYVFDFKDALAYDSWCKKQSNTYTFQREIELLLEQLNPLRGSSIIDIGCGTGKIFKHLLDFGLNVSGIDPSPYMLDIARKEIGERVDMRRGYAEELPFDDNEFNHACLITTLEYTENHTKAIEEACRVAKDSLFIGVLNKYAIKGIQRKIEGKLTSTIYSRARFFSIWEIKRTINKLVGDVPVSWKTVNIYPGKSGKFISSIENIDLVKKIPFGTYAGIVVTLNPKFRTKPLALKYEKGIKTGSKTRKGFAGFKEKQTDKRESF